MRRFILLLAIGLLSSFVRAIPVSAQDGPRFGGGTELLISTADNLGFGAFARGSVPVNADVSIAIAGGIAGFVLRGREDANWVFTPQIAAIVTLPGTVKAPYVLAGLGAYLPFGNTRREGGPTIHAGVGWVTQLSQSTLYWEIDPALIVESSRIDLAIPLRLGVIF
jgi:hypothetical protein